MKGYGVIDQTLVDRTFAAFDTDGNGVLNFKYSLSLTVAFLHTVREFVSGLSIITRGTTGDKFECTVS